MVSAGLKRVVHCGACFATDFSAASSLTTYHKGHTSFFNIFSDSRKYMVDAG